MQTGDLVNNASRTGTPMRLTACGCGAAYFQREQRKWWMKPLSQRRLYRCLACDATLFLSPELVNQLLVPPQGNQGSSARQAD